MMSSLRFCTNFGRLPLRFIVVSSFSFGARPFLQPWVVGSIFYIFGSHQPARHFWRGRKSQLFFFSGRAISETSHFWARGLYTASHLLSFMVRLLHVYTYGVWVCWGYNCAHFVFTFTRRLYIYIMYEVAHADFRVSSLQRSFVFFKRPPTLSFRRPRVGGNQKK